MIISQRELVQLAYNCFVVEECLSNVALNNNCVICRRTAQLWGLSVPDRNQPSNTIL